MTKHKVSDEYDYIIIGSGSSGGFVTYRMSEDPSVRVLLLEAGPSDNHWTTRIPAGARYTFTGGPRNWSFSTEPEPYMNGRVLFQPRGKTLGGSSSLNGMVFVRGHPLDYNLWFEGDSSGWSYADVLPYFRSIEKYAGGEDEFRGRNGPITVQKLLDNHPIEDAFLEAGTQIGYANPDDYNGAEQEGVTAFDANINSGWRSGTARECVHPASKRPNVTVLTGAFVTRVVIENGRANAVTYQLDGKSFTVQAQCEVILSAGAFQSPQLLMLSGVGPADELVSHGIPVIHDLPGVGQNLQDHLEVHIKYRCAEGLSKNYLTAKHRILFAGFQWYLFKTGPAATSHSRVGAFLRSGDHVEYPNIQFHFWPYYIEGWNPPPDKDGYCFDVGPVRSESRGWVKLRSSDPFAAPRIQMNGLSNERELEEFRIAIGIAREMAAQSAFDFCQGQEVSPGENIQSDRDLDQYIRQNANSAYHPCGTAKMGSDEMSVVDYEAKVHGVEGLRVADASIMPAITNGNINAPCMMIGERVAHMIMRKLPAE